MAQIEATELKAAQVKLKYATCNHGVSDADAQVLEFACTEIDIGDIITAAKNPPCDYFSLANNQVLLHRLVAGSEEAE